MPVPKNSRLLFRAKELRKNMTSQERKLWYRFLRRYPVKIYRQRIIDSFIVDFYCARAKLVIEVDGSQHYSQQGLADDRKRTAVFSRYQLEVLRFTNGEIDTSFSEVCDLIHAAIQKQLAAVAEPEKI